MLPFYEYKPELLNSWAKKDEVLSNPVHLHNHMEIIYIDKGELSIKTLDNQYILRKDEIALIFPHTAHSYEAVNNSPIDYHIAIFKIDDIIDFKKTLYTQHPSSPVISCKQIHKDIKNIMCELTTLNTKSAELPDENKIPLIHALLQLLLARLIPLLDLKPNTEKYEFSAEIQAIKYLNEHYNEPITLSTLAFKIGINRFALSRLFNDRLHISFSKYLNYLRIESAKTLLSNSDKTVTEVAFESGYETLRTFNRVFRGLIGLSPLQFRNSITKKQ